MRFFLFLLFSPLVFAQQLKSVNFISASASLEINPVKRNVVGKMTYTFDVKEKIDTIRIDAQKMAFSDVKINDKKVSFSENKKQLLLFEGFKKGNNTVSFAYEAFPTQAFYFVNWDFTAEIDTAEEVQGQIWTQGQGKYTSNWLPSFDDVNEKVIFAISVRFQKSFEVISNGLLQKKTAVGDDFIWEYAMSKPMSSYLVVLAIGHFQKQTSQSASGIPLENYSETGDTQYLEPTYRNNNKVFDFLESEIGYPYPWGIYRQIPVRDFLYAGMENTSSTLFSRDFVVDSVGCNDRNFLNISAHELAHQWFGNLVTAQSGKDHWLQEGFATYYALLAEREVFGDDYFQYKLYTNSRQIWEASKTDTIPILNEKASSLSLYQKGALALHVLRETIGKQSFNRAVKIYLEKYNFQNVTTDNFLEIVASVSNFNTTTFKKHWLEETEFRKQEVDTVLLKNEFMKRYFELRDFPLDLKKDPIKMVELMQSNAYYPLKQLLLYKTISEPFASKSFLFTAAMATNDLEVRQAVAYCFPDIPEAFRESYESLLSDASYETRETALYNLWKLFPDQHKRYLSITKDWIGYQDMNLKITHLYFAYLEESDAKKKVTLYLQLLRFTGSNYDSNTQQQALQKILNLEIYTEDVLRSLVYGMGNHRWQFVKFCKENIRKLVKDQKYRTVFGKMKLQLPIREKTQLQRLLDEK